MKQMDLCDKVAVQALLRSYGLKAKKVYGQHFLVDRRVLSSILRAAYLTRPDQSRTILEIGPGLGVLTRELVARAGRVIAVEADRLMSQMLRQTVGSRTNLTVISCPVQHFRRADYLSDFQYDLVANLPFNVSSFVIQSFLSQSPRPCRLVIMVQKEVAERAVAPPGSSARGLLSLIVELLAQKAEIITSVSPESFWPVPEVKSAILKIEGVRHVQPAPLLLSVAKAAFNQRRKKIKNSLPRELVARLKDLEIDDNLRAQDLSLKQWQKLCQGGLD